MNQQDDPESEDAPLAPSKSQRKRESTALQDMGAELVKLPAERVRNLDLPEYLRVAVLDAQRIRSHGALRRQMQFIGKLMRSLDVEPITEQLAALRGDSERAKARFHALEHWRERLLSDEAAVTDWQDAYPGSDVQQLRQLIRNARKEAAEQKPPRAFRALFRLLSETANATPD
jgi:ribosome-associated protein